MTTATDTQEPATPGQVPPVVLVPIMVSVPLNQWSKLHQRVGFLEGALKGLRYVDDVEKSLNLIEDRYEEMS